MFAVICSYAFYKTAHTFVFSKDQLQQAWDSFKMVLDKKAVSPEVRAQSVQFGEAIAAHVFKSAAKDGFAKTRTMARFTPGKAAGDWQQTSPDYMEAVQPYWNMIRTMTASKANAFLLPAPARYKSEKFLAECKEVYEAGKNIMAAQKAFTNFWDCNPYTPQTVEHMMYSVKKISPARPLDRYHRRSSSSKKAAACRKLYTRTAWWALVYLLPSFVAGTKSTAAIICACHSYTQTDFTRLATGAANTTISRISKRPGVISAAPATILTHLYGEGFRYVDDVEKDYGLPARSFKSFFDAANEAAISRLYGGIHFRESL
jgi:hypothetical protein